MSINSTDMLLESFEYKDQMNNENIIPSLIKINGTTYYLEIENMRNINYHRDIFNKILYQKEKDENKDKILISKRTRDSIKYKSVFFSNIWFSPNSKIKLFWDIFILLIILLFTCLFTFDNSFHELNISESFILFELLLILDMVFYFNTGYYDSQNNLVVNKKMISIKYFFFWFWIDLMSSIPTYSFLFIIKKMNEIGPENNLFKSLIVLKFFLFARIYKILKSFDYINFSNKIILLRYNMNIVIFLLFIQYFFFILFLSHFGTCFMYYISSVSNLTSSNEFSDMVSYYGINSENIVETYIIFLFYFVQTISTVGYGSYTPQTIKEKIIVIAYLALFSAVFSSLIGAISIIFDYRYSIDSKERKIVSILVQISDGLPKILKEKVKIELYDSLKRKENKIYTKKEIRNILNQKFFKQIEYKFSYKFVKQISPFNKFELLSLYLSEELIHNDFISEEILFEENKKITRIWMIIKGKIILTKNYPSKNIKINFPNAVFGNGEFILDEKNWKFGCKSYSITTVVSIKIQSILTVYNNLLNKNKDLYDEIMDQMKKIKVDFKSNNFNVLGISCFNCWSSDHLNFDCISI